MRLLAGLIVQPFLAGALAFLFFPVLLLDWNGHTLAGGSPADATNAAWSVAIGAGVVALVVTVVGVVPTTLWLTKRKRVSFAEALLFGLGFGDFPFLVGALLAGTYGFAGFARGVAFSSLLGVTGAAVFWAIAIRGEP